MPDRHRTRSWKAGVLGAAAAACALAAAAQIAENPADPLGVAIPYPLVHLVHAPDAARAGTTGWLRARDSFLFYQLGRDLLHRQFRLEHGVYGQPAALTVPLYVGATRPQVIHGTDARFARDHTASCGICHSSQYREPGAGQTIASTGGLGRNTSHFYGGGLVEMLGAQVRAQVLARYDADRDGRLDRAEIAGPSPVAIRPAPGAPPIDYGDLSPGPDGVPRLNPVFRVWYLDERGAVLPDAVGLADPRVAALDLVMQPFGWGRGFSRVDGRLVSQGGESTTLREFYTVAADFHMGLQAHDPVQMPAAGAPTGAGGLARVSLNGARQFDFGGSPDRGLRRTPTGLSLDDPDRDGHLNELTEGDVDAVEFYLLHAPAPAVRATARSERGREVLLRIGCARCHVESWRIEARDERRGLPGDRRLFHLATRAHLAADGTTEIVATLEPRWRRRLSGQLAPAGGAFPVERIYTDFKHWDLGPGYHERRFDGTLQREHRTAPLWGVGSSAPYGHDGSYLTLEEAILAHGGAAERESAAFRALPEGERELLLDYLRSLVLYATDEIPADVDRDGRIAEELVVAGEKVGPERFDARFLFARPPRYREIYRAVAPHGRTRPLALIDNVAEAYGLGLPARADRDGDGFPDLIDPLPEKKGLTP